VYIRHEIFTPQDSSTTEEDSMIGLDVRVWDDEVRPSARQNLRTRSLTVLELNTGAGCGVQTVCLCASTTDSARRIIAALRASLDEWARVADEVDAERHEGMAARAVAP
jgi:hypothetical protein